jgi:hypothetical protein
MTKEKTANLLKSPSVSLLQLSISTNYFSLREIVKNALFQRKHQGLRKKY